MKNDKEIVGTLLGFDDFVSKWHILLLKISTNFPYSNHRYGIGRCH